MHSQLEKLEISKFLQSDGLQLKISKVFLDHENNFSHCRSEQFLNTKYQFLFIIYFLVNYGVCNKIVLYQNVAM